MVRSSKFTGRFSWFPRFINSKLTQQPFRFRHKPQFKQSIVKLVRISGLGPNLRAHAIDGRLIQLSDVCCFFRIEPAALENRARSTFLKRRVVKIRVWPGV